MTPSVKQPSTCSNAAAALQPIYPQEKRGGGTGGTQTYHEVRGTSDTQTNNEVRTKQERGEKRDSYQLQEQIRRFHSEQGMLLCL